VYEDQESEAMVETYLITRRKTHAMKGTASRNGGKLLPMTTKTIRQTDVRRKTSEMGYL
jgi:hypothetical protein